MKRIIISVIALLFAVFLVGCKSSVEPTVIETHAPTEETYS